MPQVAVVIPAYNEADRVGDTVAGAARLPDADLVVVVDDGSRDATARVAEEAGASVLRHARNRGKAAAMETGGVEQSRRPRTVPAALTQTLARVSRAVRPPLVPAWRGAFRAVAPYRHAVRMTQTPTSSEMPEAFTTGMNSAGDTSPRSGCRQRMSASAPIRRRSAISICG